RQTRKGERDEQNHLVGNGRRRRIRDSNGRFSGSTRTHASTGTHRTGRKNGAAKCAWSPPPRAGWPRRRVATESRPQRDDRAGSPGGEAEPAERAQLGAGAGQDRTAAQV